MGDLPSHPIHSFMFAGPDPSAHLYTAPPSNLGPIHTRLHDSPLPLPPRYSSPSYRPRSIDDFNGWNRSPHGMFPSTLVGPGQNPSPPHHPQSSQPPNTSVVSANNLGKRKRTTPPGGTPLFGGFGPLSSGETTPEMSSPASSLPPPASNDRRNGAADVWAFARPLTSDAVLAIDKWPTYLEPNHTSRPKDLWFGCKLCTKFGYAIR